MLVIQNEFECNQLFINENGTIKEVTFESMQILKKEDTHIVIWKCKHNGVDMEITTEYGQCPFSPRVEMAVENCTNILTDNRLYVRGTVIPVLYDNDMDQFYLNVFTLRNGVVKYQRLELKSIIYKKRCNRVSVELVEDVKYYETKDECIAFNKITKIDYNGNESNFKNSGYMQDMVAYTDEQKKVIKTLQKAFKDAKECGLKCLMGDSELRLINAKSFSNCHISDSEWDCDNNNLNIYLTEDVAKVDGVYHNYSERPVLVAD